MKNDQFDEKSMPDGIEAGMTPETADVQDNTEPAGDTPDAVLNDAVGEDMPAENLMESQPKKKGPNRRLRYGGMAVLVTVLVVVGAVVLNILADVMFNRFPLSLDLTSDDRYTVSQETVDMIKTVDKPVEIIAFFREEDINNPGTTLAEMNTVYKQLHETWNQYKLQSGGKVTVQYVDLTNQPALLTQYKSYGDIQEGSILFRSGEGSAERYRLKTINDFYSYETDQYGYSLTSFTSKVEMTTASCVKAVISDVDIQAMLLTGHDEDSATASTLKDLFGLNGYTVEEVNLSSAQEIGEKVTTAIVAAPAKDFTDAEITRLRDWLTNDGKLGRNLMVVLNNLATSKDCPNLYEFLNDGYQIEVTDNQVVETTASRAYAGSAQVIYGDLPESPIQETAKEAGVLNVMPRQIVLKAGTDTSKPLYNIPMVTFPESSRIASLLDGENAEAKEAGEYPVVGMGMAVKWTYDNSGEESVMVQTNVVVCNQGLANDTVFKMQNVQNEKVVLDAMNYINGQEDSITISGKDLTQTSLEFSAGSANTLGILLAIVLPVGMLVICLVVFLRRRHL